MRNWEKTGRFKAGVDPGPPTKMPPYIAPEVNAAIGYWGRPSSTLDWCEENHAWSYYVAEFWNTVSNLAMIIPALIGMWSCFKSGLEPRYMLSYFGLLVVGVGSTLFHGTLTYSMQLLDELPMLIFSSCLLFALYEMGQKDGWNRRTYVTATLLVLYPSLVSTVYIVINDPTFHEVAYGLMVFAMTVHGFYCVIHYNSGKYFTFAVVSISVYVLGFILWNIDNTFCPSLRVFRNSSPPTPLGALSQFHAWWHVLAGMGTYLHIILSSRMRMEFLQYQTRLNFPCGLPLLEVSKIPNKKE